MDSIKEKRAQRLRFMNELYDVLDGRQVCFADKKRFLNKLGLDLTKEEDFDKFQSIAEYLKGEGLITTIDTLDRGVIEVGLTHEGVREVEEARNQPNESTKHFAPINIVYANSITNSPIQQSSPGASQSLTIVNQSGLQEIETFLRSLKQSVDQLGLDEDQRAELVLCDT